MKHIKLLVFVFVCMGLFGCGTKTKQIIDWSNLHRVGPNTEARIYVYNADQNEWFLTDDEFVIPEGHFISPPPSVDDPID